MGESLVFAIVLVRTLRLTHKTICWAKGESHPCLQGGKNLKESEEEDER
jgi:hypothetical protein